MKLPFIIETQLNKILKPNIITVIETRIDGKLSRRFYGKSLVGNFLQAFYCQNANLSANFLGSGAPWNNNQQGIRINGALGALNTAVTQSDAPAGNLTRGLIFGSNNTAPTPGDFVINTLIANGSGAGQLNYGAQTSPAGCNIAGANTVLTLRRSATNNSGGVVTVREVAYYITSSAISFMIYRDAVSPDDVINNGQTYTVDLVFTITT